MIYGHNIICNYYNSHIMSEKKVSFSEKVEVSVIPETDFSAQTFEPSQTIINKLDKNVFNDLFEIHEDAEFMSQVINNYTTYYKKVYKKPQHYTLLSEIDPSNMTSTNHSLEHFYNEFCKFSQAEKENSDSVKIYEYKNRDMIKNIDDELYGILIDGNAGHLSKSFIAILIEYTNLCNEFPDKKIEIISLV